MLDLPSDYVLRILHQYGDSPEKTSSGYKCGCPVCHEGKSLKSKKRLYYMTGDNYLYCHNCTRGWSAYGWVKQVTGKSFSEILAESKASNDFNYSRVESESTQDVVHFTVPALPDDSINLMDGVQVKFYEDDYYVKLARDYIKSRRLDTAAYRPKYYYLSKLDRVHQNRLIIPFFDSDGIVSYYQSRALTQKQEIRAKYLSKLDCDKQVFNFSKIDYAFGYMFVMEGALDAMFLRNAVSASGVFLTPNQKRILSSCIGLKRIWMFDNPHVDTTGKAKMLEKAEMCPLDLFFPWSDEFREYKDLNQYCVENKTDEVPVESVLSKCIPGHKAVLS